MFNLKKIFLAGASLVLAAGIIAPISATNVSSAAIKIKNDYITADKAFEIETTFDGKTTGTTETYKKNQKAYLDYLKGKKATLKITEVSGDSKTVTVEKAEKVTATFNKVDYNITVKADGTELDYDNSTVKERLSVMYKNTEVGRTDLEDYTVKGATLTVGLDAYATGSSIYQASNVVKVKIPAKKKGPKITLDYSTVSFKLPANCRYEVYAPGNLDSVITSGASTTAEPISLADVVTGGGLTFNSEKVTGAAVIMVYKKAGTKSLESKATVVEVPQQVIVTDTAISSTAGISLDYALNSSKTDVTGIKIVNNSDIAYEFAVVDATTDLEKIKLTGTDRVKFTKIAKKGSKATTKVVKKAKAAEGSIVIFRIPGNKKTSTKVFTFASKVKTLGTVKYPVKIPNNLTVTVSTPSTAAVTASKASISVKLPSESTVTKCYYVFAKKAPEAVAMDITTEGLTNEVKTDGTKCDFEVKTSEVGSTRKSKNAVIVYGFDKDGKLVAFGTATISSSVIQ